MDVKFLELKLHLTLLKIFEKIIIKISINVLKKKKNMIIIHIEFLPLVTTSSHTKIIY
jgi:hypothetical protein